MIIGFIGTGTITARVVAGLLSADPETRIVVSLRSAAISSVLKAKYPQIEVQADIGALVARADVIVLGVRPAQVDEALAGVNVAPGKTVISFVSGLPLAELQSRFAQCAVARVVPLPAISRLQGPILAVPPLPIVQTLFGALGDLIMLDTEAQLLALSPLSAFMSTYFALQESLTDYAINAGAAERHASFYVRSLLASLATTGLETADEGRHHLSREHETPGGLNERVRRYLANAGWFEQPRLVMDELGGLSRDQLKAPND